VHLPVLHKTQTFFFSAKKHLLTIFLPLFLGLTFNNFLATIYYIFGYKTFNTLFFHQVESLITTSSVALYYSFTKCLFLLISILCCVPLFCFTMGLSSCFCHSKVHFFVFDMILVFLILSPLSFWLRFSIYAYLFFLVLVSMCKVLNLVNEHVYLYIL